MIPISLIDENRVFDLKGNAYAYFVLEGSAYAFVSLQKKVDAIRATDIALMTTLGEYSFFLLSQQHSIQQIGSSLNYFSQDLWWGEQVKLTEKYLEQELPSKRLNVLCFPLKGLNKELGLINVLKGIWEGTSSLVNKANVFVSNEATISEQQVNDAEQESARLLKLLNFKGLRPASFEETEWCLKKGYFRGIKDPESKIPHPFPKAVITQGNKRLIRPNRAVLLTLTEGKVRQYEKHLEIFHDNKEVSYQAFLPVLDVPAEIDHAYPVGHEWIYGVMERLDFPVDCAIHIRMEPHGVAKAKVEQKNKRAKEQAKEWLKGGSQEDAMFLQDDIPDELMEDLETINELWKKFRERQPLAFVKVVFSVGANNIDTLNRRVRSLKELAEEKNVTVTQPTSEALQMFQAFYPFSSKMDSAYEMAMDPGILAAGVPFGIRKLGDPVGFLLGKLFTGKAVFMDLVRPMTKLNRSGAVLIAGIMGAGKTFLMKLLMAHALMWGAYGFTNDPKGDWRTFCEHPKIKPISKIISFTPGSDTLFTPFRLGQNKEQCYEAAMGILEVIVNKKNDEHRNLVIMDALNKLYKTDKWDMFTFFEIIKETAKNHPNPVDREHAYIILRYLRSLPNHPIGKMIFGRDDGKHIFEDKKFVVTITRGLSLPDRGTDRKDWNLSESLSVAMMFAIMTLAIRYLTSLPTNTLKALGWEEYWFLKTFSKGVQLYNEALRLSRSEKMLVIMASQNATDADMQNDNNEKEDITGMFGWKFMLRMDSPEQVKFALHKLMEMPEEKPEDWMNTFSNVYFDGKGLVRDPEGNVGELQITALDPELIKYIGSTPE